MEAPGFRQVLNMSWAIMNTYGMAVDHFARKLYMADFEKTGEFTGPSPALGTSRKLFCVFLYFPPVAARSFYRGWGLLSGANQQSPKPQSLHCACAPADKPTCAGFQFWGQVWIVPELFPHQFRSFSHQSWFIPVP